MKTNQNQINIDELQKELSYLFGNSLQNGNDTYESYLQHDFHGTKVSELQKTFKINPHDLFLITQISNYKKVQNEAYIINDYFDGRFFLEDEIQDNYGRNFIINEELQTILSGDRNSYAIEFKDISGIIHQRVIDGIEIGSMSREDKEDYSFIGHNHDDIYSKFDLSSKYTKVEKENDCILMNIILSDFSESGEITVRNIDIVYNKPSLPKFKYDDIGTVKFVAYTELTDDVKQYDDKYNVDIYSENFDGWVYPNGTIFNVGSSEFEDACETYSSSTYSNSFQVPDLNNFIKLNPGIYRDDAMKFTSFQNSVPSHKHSIDEVQITGTPSIKSYDLNAGNLNENITNGSGICGFGDGTTKSSTITAEGYGKTDNIVFNNLKTEKTDSSYDVESKPNHNLMPIKIFIGFKERVEK